MLLILMGWTLLLRPVPRTEQRPSTSGYRVDINQADSAELRLLPGVGKTTARRIVDQREVRGRFTRVSQLQSVRWVGEKKIAQMKPFVTLGP